MSLTSALLPASLLAAGLFASTSTRQAAMVRGDVDFVRDVHPILAEHCFACHGAKKQKGELRLDQRAGLFESEDPSWIPVVPENPEASALFERISLPADDPDVMPAKGDLLTAEQIETLRRWIEQGAPWEEVLQPEVAEASRVNVEPLIEALLIDSAGAPPVDFDRDIRPILSENCFQCHGPDEAQRKAGLRLDTREWIVSKEDRPYGLFLITPGNARASEIAHRVLQPDAEEVMPPPHSGRALDEEEKRTLIRWIEEGAKWEEHWAFRAPSSPARPAVKNEAWPRNEIDHFILARLEAEGLPSSQEADRFTLLRRVTLDLTGLPPTPAEVEAFTTDVSSDAYERVVDRLLASPRYGEHQARFWLDAARYGDTHGLHLDNYREMWPYRDWVINAFNNNLPFDQFVVEQLAGDLLPDAGLDQQVASGFNRCHVTTNEGGSIEEEVYVRNVIDRVNTVGTVFMGLTVGCAACHDHKFDPITQREFFGLFAFFNNLDGKPMDGNAKVHDPVVRVPSAQQVESLTALMADREAVQEAAELALARIDYSEPAIPVSDTPPSKTTTIWVDDEVPVGVVPEGQALVWAESPAEPVRAGRRSMKRKGAGLHQHVFRNADRKLRIAGGDVLFAWVYLDPADAPREIMLQFNGDGAADWGHRAFWGENLINWGTDDTTERHRMGDLPTAGRWVKLEVPVELVGLAPGRVVHGMAFTQFDGTAYWDEAGISSSIAQEAEDHDWLDDETPAGAVLAGDGASWNWVSGDDHPVLSGELSLRRSGGGGLNQDYFTQARPLLLAAGDRLYAHAWLDPDDPPRSVQLQFNDGTWEHRARWGEPAHGSGRAGGADLHSGDLPPTGEWVRLEVPIAAVGLKAGANLNGWAFTQVGGTVYWDRAGIHTWSPPDDRHLTSQRAWEALAGSDGDLPSRVRDALKVARETRDEEQAQSIRDHYLRNVYAPTRAVFGEINARDAAITVEEERVEGQVATTLVMKERSDIRPSFLLERGQYDIRGEEVARATPSMLPPMDPVLPMNRLGLSRWLVDPEHPLTARVAVNRFWQQLFGVGLVETSEDFGNQGSRPSHPALLDWLATRFVADGWDVKRTLRRLVLSATYRQEAQVDALSEERDPENRLLGRGPRFRLGAEVLRDQALALGDLLVERIGGPSVKPPQPDGLWHAVGYTSSNTARFKADEEPDDVHRRTLYTFLKRTSPPPQMSTFDAPSRESSCVRRERTNTPLQALLLMNDPQFVEAAHALARRILREGGETEEQRASYALGLVTCRPPMSQDREDILTLLRAQEEEFRANPEAAQALLAFSGGAGSADLDPVALASWTIVANLLLNLDEVIMKG